MGMINWLALAKAGNNYFLFQARHLEPKPRTHVLLYASHGFSTLADALGTKNLSFLIASSRGNGTKNLSFILGILSVLFAVLNPEKSILKRFSLAEIERQLVDFFFDSFAV